MLEELTSDRILALLLGLIIPLAILLIVKIFRSKRQVQKAGDNSISIQASGGSLTFSIDKAKKGDTCQINKMLSDGSKITIRRDNSTNDKWHITK